MAKSLVIVESPAKAKTIENYLKSNIQVVESQHPNLKNLDFILENKATNEFGMTMLHVALLELAEVKFEIVLTSDRSIVRFDPEFEAYLLFYAANADFVETAEEAAFLAEIGIDCLQGYYLGRPTTKPHWTTSEDARQAS